MLLHPVPDGEGRPRSRFQLLDQHHFAARRALSALAHPTAEDVALWAATLKATLLATRAFVHHDHDINGHDGSP